MANLTNQITMKKEKFKTLDSDFDSLVGERVFSGRFTKRRRKILEKSVRRFNHNRSHPYGTSPNGYAYTCGCEHDCCGCLSREYAMLSIDHHRFLKITIIQTFNF